MSQTILSVLILLAAQILPHIGVTIGTDQLTTVITTLVTIGAALWIWIRRVQAGDVKLFGGRK